MSINAHEPPTELGKLNLLPATVNPGSRSEDAVIMSTVEDRMGRTVLKHPSRRDYIIPDFHIYSLIGPKRERKPLAVCENKFVLNPFQQLIEYLEQSLAANPEVIGIGARVNKDGKGLEFLLVQGDPNELENGCRIVLAKDGSEWHSYDSEVFYRTLLEVAVKHWQTDDESDDENGDEE
ncbi:hypothetical protein D9757_009213 [Collybiopsis confluens]|uniref:Uncharacterized protein n=1 Tax=Collybiopsis confluens TaxID=2823264 RepID=A0A8H5HA87_9AGAR|nr:hypothetical protein D9757_009213 [Collybiopsis confluens]